MSLQKLCNELARCNEKFVTVEIKGSITIPYFIENFEFSEDEHSIGFGESECEDYPFQIHKDSITDIEFLNEDYVHLKFSIKFNEFVTILVVLCEEFDIYGGCVNE